MSNRSFRGEVGEMSSVASIQDLLAKQLLAIEEARAYQLEIATRLGAVGSLEELETRPSTRASLKEPLLKKKHTDKVVYLRHVPTGRIGKVVQQDKTDEDYTYKLEFSDGKSPLVDWYALDECERLDQKARQNKKPVFADVDEEKRKVRQKFAKPYNVEDLYHKAGLWQRVAKASWFKLTALGVICMNSLWIAYDTNYNQAPNLAVADPQFVIAENFFCIFFSCEILVRFMAFKDKRHCWQDGWFVFDSFLVALMVWETWIETLIFLVYETSAHHAMNTSILRIFRLFRLIRIMRMGRVVRNVPEFMVLFRAMFMAFKSVGVTFLLLMVINYIFSIMFTQLFRTEQGDDHCFTGVGSSFNCLLIEGLFPESGEMLKDLLGRDMLFFSCMILYLIIAHCTIMNLLIGLLFEGVRISSETEKEEMDAQALETELDEIIDHKHMVDQGISQDDFKTIMDNTDAIKLLKNIGVDLMGLVDYADAVFESQETIKLGVFIKKVLQFRGAKPATHRDLLDSRRYLVKEIDEAEEQIISAILSRIDGSGRQMSSPSL